MKWSLCSMTASVSLLGLAMNLSAPAATLYKCRDARGEMSYQETPCASSAKELSVQHIQREPDRPDTSWSAQASQGTEVRVQRDGGEYARAIPDPSQGYSSNDSERRALIAELDSRISAIGTPNSAGKREFLAQLLAQKAQLVSNGSVQPPAAPNYRQRPAERTPPAPQTDQVHDQFGNAYTRPAGSAFVRDNKTGKQCFTYGNFVECK